MWCSWPRRTLRWTRWRLRRGTPYVWSNTQYSLINTNYTHRKAVAERIQRAEQAGLQESERMSFVLATYQRNLEVSESKLAAAQQENVDLHIQISQLVQSGGKSNAAPSSSEAQQQPPQSVVTEAVKSPVARSADSLAEDQQRDSKQLAMYETLTSEIQDLKRQLLGSRAGRFGDRLKAAVDSSGLDDMPAVSDSGLFPETEISGAALSAALKPTPPGTPSKAVALKGDSADSGATGRRQSGTVVTTTSTTLSEQPSSASPQQVLLQQQVEECRAYIKQLEGDASGAMSQHLRIAESRALAMSTKCAALEEELRSYQQYMRNVVPQYKKQLQLAKQQLALAMKANGGAGSAVAVPGSSSTAGGGDGSDLKLPLIK